MSIQYQYFPKDEVIPPHLSSVVDVFRKHESQIDSNTFRHRSNTVLKMVSSDMIGIGYEVETGKSFDKKIRIPIGPNQYVEPDGIHRKTNTILEVEAGRALANNQYSRDLEKAMCIGNTYLVIAVRNIYGKSKDFERVVNNIDNLYINNCVQHRVNGVLIIGY